MKKSSEGKIQKPGATVTSQVAENSEAGHTPGNKHYFQGEMLNRLKKIEGQVRGVYKMIQEGRNCGDIVIQLAAIKAAVNRVGTTVLACHLADQLENSLKENKDIKDSLEEFMHVYKKFS